MTQRATVGRQTGQSIHVVGTDDVDFWIEFVKCQNGYCRVKIECANDFRVEYGTGLEGRPGVTHSREVKS